MVSLSLFMSGLSSDRIELGDSRLAIHQNEYRSTGFPASFALVLRWLADCLMSHPHCKRAAESPPFHPTRLIYVGVHEDSPILLQEGSSLHVNGPCVALSHCWGKSPTIKSADADLPGEDLRNPISEHQLQSGVSFSKLPQTVQETCVVVRKTGNLLPMDRLPVHRAELSQRLASCSSQDAFDIEQRIFNDRCNRLSRRS